MARAILSVVIALVATVVGHAMLWIGGASVLRTVGNLGRVDPSEIALALGGAVLIGLAMATVAFSSLGAIVLGILDILFGLVATVIPGSFGLYGIFSTTLRPFGLDLLSGSQYALSTGVTFIGGVILLVGGLATLRLSPSPFAVRVILPIADAAATPFALGLLVIAAGLGFARMERFASTSPTAIGAMLTAAVLLAVMAITARWSAVGVTIVGAVTFVLAAVGMIAIREVFRITLGVGPSGELGLGAQLLIGSGNLAMLGALFVGLGVGRRFRGRTTLSA